MAHQVRRTSNNLYADRRQYNMLQSSRLPALPKTVLFAAVSCRFEHSSIGQLTSQQTVRRM